MFYILSSIEMMNRYHGFQSQGQEMNVLTIHQIPNSEAMINSSFCKNWNRCLKQKIIIFYGTLK